MKIRAITLGANIQLPVQSGALVPRAHFLRAGRQAFEDAGFEVQTTRLATQPLGDLLDGRDPVSMGIALEQTCRDDGIEYISLGTIRPGTDRHLIPIVPEVVAATERSFVSVSVSSRSTGIDLAAISQTAAAIKRIGEMTPSGFGNHRFAALANCPPNIPFFPGGYHNGGRDTFTIGLEAADLVLGAFEAPTSLEAARTRLVRAIEDVAARLEVVADRLADEHGIAFGGLDFSTAPFPVPEISTANAIERLGVDSFGGAGTLFAAALITDALKQSHFRKAGYCGLFLPVLEDSVLASRSAEGAVSLDTLLLCSVVCGTGLDLIPLPGDTSPAQLASIILDVATVAVVLDKPLTCRLVPIPGAQAGDVTNFDFQFFANTRVMPLKGPSSSRILERSELVSLGPR